MEPRHLIHAILDALEAALLEDIGAQDISSAALPLNSVRAQGRLLVKVPGVMAGMEILPRVLGLPALGVSGIAGGGQARVFAREGQRVEAGFVAAEFDGDARTLLALERSLLNLLSRMCGVATLTARFVDKITGTHAVICDTRKTAPGLRAADKYAVACGGGVNHRMGLFDEIMLKENHLALARLSIPDAIAAARRSTAARLTCEAENLAQVEDALEYGADCVLLDDFKIECISQAVALRKRMGKERIPFEVSGGVTLDSVRDIALTGVERISIGALTHSAPALDLSLKMTRLT